MLSVSEEVFFSVVLSVIISFDVISFELTLSGFFVSSGTVTVVSGSVGVGVVGTDVLVQILY